MLGRRTSSKYKRYFRTIFRYFIWRFKYNRNNPWICLSLHSRSHNLSCSIIFEFFNENINHYKKISQLKQTQKEWQTVFIICAIIYFIGGCVYVLFCDANVQSWAVKSQSHIDLTSKPDNVSNLSSEGFVNLAFDPSTTIRL